MSDFLIHYGVQGQKWGVRRYQYQDGSYTSEGRIHYGIGDGRRSKSTDLAHATEVQLPKDPITQKEKKKILSDDAKKALMIIGGVALAAGVAYGVYAVSQNLPPETAASILDAVGANSNTEEQIESLSKVVDSEVIDKVLEKPIESTVSKNIAEALNTSISDVSSHEYTIEGSEKANELFNRVMNEPMKFASHHLNPITFGYDNDEISESDYNSVNKRISDFIKTNGIPDNALIKNTPNYGKIKVANYDHSTGVEKVYEFAKNNPNVLAFSNSMIADAYGRDTLFNSSKWISEPEVYRTAVEKYTGSEYNIINSVLRGTNYEAPPSRKEKAKDWANRITRVIDKNVIPEDIMIHRSIKLDSNTLEKFFYDDNVIGKTFFDKAFGSNSLSNYDVALNHNDPSRVVIHSIAPKGTKAMYVEPITKVEHELELLLQRGSGYKILDVVKDNTGRITDVFAQIVQPETLEDI